MRGHAVVRAGGQTGMMPAAGLALAGTDVASVEPRASPELSGSRAGDRASRRDNSKRRPAPAGKAACRAK